MDTNPEIKLSTPLKRCQAPKREDCRYQDLDRLTVYYERLGWLTERETDRLEDICGQGHILKVGEDRLENERALGLEKRKNGLKNPLFFLSNLIQRICENAGLSETERRNWISWRH